jgi:hypothetical protein
MFVGLEGRVAVVGAALSRLALDAWRKRCGSAAASGASSGASSGSHLVRAFAVALGELESDFLGADGKRAIEARECIGSLPALGELDHCKATDGAIVRAALVHILGDVYIPHSAVCREDGLELLWRDVSW